MNKKQQLALFGFGTLIAGIWAANRTDSLARTVGAAAATIGAVMTVAAVVDAFGLI